MCTYSIYNSDDDKFSINDKQFKLIKSYLTLSILVAKTFSHNSQSTYNII